MTDRELLIELLAIKLYEHDCWAEKLVPHWTTEDAEDRVLYRVQATVIAASDEPEPSYAGPRDTPGS